MVISAENNWFRVSFFNCSYQRSVSALLVRRQILQKSTQCSNRVFAQLLVWGGQKSSLDLITWLAKECDIYDQRMQMIIFLVPIKKTMQMQWLFVRDVLCSSSSVVNWGMTEDAQIPTQLTYLTLFLGNTDGKKLTQHTRSRGQPNQQIQQTLSTIAAMCVIQIHPHTLTRSQTPGGLIHFCCCNLGGAHRIQSTRPLDFFADDTIVSTLPFVCTWRD